MGAARLRAQGETHMNAPTPFAASLAFLALNGCFVGYAAGPRPAVVNSPPLITYADAGCEWDPGYQDYVWAFDADADDPDGLLDVVTVYADVYDNIDGK